MTMTNSGDATPSAAAAAAASRSHGRSTSCLHWSLSVWLIMLGCATTALQMCVLSTSDACASCTAMEVTRRHAVARSTALCKEEACAEAALIVAALGNGVRNSGLARAAMPLSQYIRLGLSSDAPPMVGSPLESTRTHAMISQSTCVRVLGMHRASSWRVK